MKLLQNSAGNFLNMTSQEATQLAAKLLSYVEQSLTVNHVCAGGVHTLVLQEDRPLPTSPMDLRDPVLDTLFIGVSPSWLDVHPFLEDGLKPRKTGSDINRNHVNVRLKGNHS